MAKEKVTKTSAVISLMNEHASKPMTAVCLIIEDKLPCKEGYGKVWYRWAIKEGVAPGKLETGTAAPKAKTPVKAPKVKAAKTVDVKPKGNRFTGKIKTQVAPKSEDDIAKMKAANLKRMQQVTDKMKAKGLQPGQYANPDSVGVPDGWTEDGARAEVDQAYKELDSFAMPKFLTKDQVKSLV